MSYSPKILIIDDDKELSGIISDYLKTFNYAPKTCYTGASGLDYVKESLPDLVLLDINLPDANGVDIARKIKGFAKEIQPVFLPIIMISALNDESNIVRGLTEADDYINKPFSYQELVARIEVLLRIGSLQNRLDESVKKYQALYQEQTKIKKSVYRSARLASVGSMASGVAHEMNNPLAAILGFSDAILTRIKDDGEIDLNELNEYIEIIKSETLRCRDVIVDLSSFAGKPSGKFINVNISNIIESIYSLLKRKFANSGIEFDNRVSDVIICTDRQKLSHVIMDILTNSLNFCDDGDQVIISGRNEEELYYLDIVDTGKGIDTEVLSKIFDPFFTTKEVGEGIGVGLTLAYMSMKDLGGSISVSSEAGRGTTVTIGIPINGQAGSEIE